MKVPFKLLPVIVVTFLLTECIVGELDVKFDMAWIACNGLMRTKIMEKSITSLRVDNLSFAKKLALFLLGNTAMVFREIRFIRICFKESYHKERLLECPPSLL